MDILAITCWSKRTYFSLVTQEIKKAYRLVAMQCHPDKGEPMDDD